MRLLGRYGIAAVLMMGIVVGRLSAGPNLGVVPGYIATIQNKVAAYTINGAINGPDCGTAISVTVASAVNVTLPSTAVIGCQVTLIQGGAGKISPVAGGGATLNANPHGFTGTAGQTAHTFVEVVSNSGGSAAVWDFGGDGS